MHVLDAALDTLDARAIRAWSRAAVELLIERQPEIDALNVFPVPDSDTGSNVLATVRAGDRALSVSAADSGAAALRVLADGAAGAAAGNSGFLVSQLVRGFADVAEAAETPGPRTGGSPAGPVDRLGAAALAAGLRRGAELARAAVVHPVEGTILTVAEAAATAAQSAVDVAGAGGAVEGAGDLAGVLRAAVAAADAAVQRTPNQLVALADAGVVDAGGCALLVLLDALHRVVTGSPAELTPVGPAVRRRHSVPTGPAFEVQYHLTASTSAVHALRSALTRLGESVVVVAAGSAPDRWNVHVHVHDVGAAIEAGLEAGRPSGIAVTRITGPPPAERHDAPTRTAVLAVAPGPGLAPLFASADVRVVEGGADDLPDAAAVRAAIEAAGSGHIVLLPNSARLSGVAESAAATARAGGVRTAVVPTRSPVQALAAAAVHDAHRRFDDDVVAMAEAAAACRYAEISRAQERALTGVGICEPGDVLGLIDGDVVEVGRGLAAVAFNVVDRLLGVGAELMTILVGADAPPNTGRLIESQVRGRSPLTDVSVYTAGRLGHLVIIGVE